MHSAGLYHSLDLYAKLIEALGRQQQWEKALELFLSMQVSAPVRAQLKLLTLFDRERACAEAGPAALILQRARLSLFQVKGKPCCVFVIAGLGSAVFVVRGAQSM